MAARAAQRTWRNGARWGEIPYWRYAVVTFMVAAATGAMFPVRARLGVLNPLLIFLLVSYTLALLFGSGPAAFGVILSFLAVDFFFIPPFHTLTVAEPDHVLALAIYLGIAIVTGQLVGRVRAPSWPNGNSSERSSSTSSMPP